MKEIISSLDIGSNEVKLVVGEVYGKAVHVLAAAEVKSKGIKRGLIVNPEEALVSFNEVVGRVNEMLNIKIDKVILSVPSYFASFMVSEGSTTITNEESIVEGIDIVRTLQGSVYNKIPNNKELITIMPIEFTIDEDKKVIDPKGQKATKLSAKVVLGLAPKKNIYTTLSLLDNIGITVVDLCFGGFADYSEFRNKETDKTVGAVVNVGESKTEISIINRGILAETVILEIGGRNIDKDICYTYDISRKDAVMLKEKFSMASKRNASTSWSEEVLTNTGENIKINQYEISEIVNNRLTDMLDLSKKQINLLTKKEISYIIVTGGVSMSTDFNLLLEEVFGKEIEAYKVNEMGVRHNKYSTAVGLIKYYYDKLSFRNKLAYTVDEKQQSEIMNSKKINNNSILGKIFGYFFNN